MKHNIFVYGSLKRGFNNHSLLANQQFVAHASTQSRYKLYYLGSFPGMIEVTENGCSIEGEIWCVDSTSLVHLDQLEDIAHGMYARVPIHLQPPHNTLNVEGYLYLLSIAGRRDCGTSWTE